MLSVGSPIRVSPSISDVDHDKRYIYNAVINMLEFFLSK